MTAPYRDSHRAGGTTALWELHRIGADLTKTRSEEGMRVAGADSRQAKGNSVEEDRTTVVVGVGVLHVAEVPLRPLRSGVHTGQGGLLHTRAQGTRRFEPGRRS